MKPVIIHGLEIGFDRPKIIVPIAAPAIEGIPEKADSAGGAEEA